MSLHPDAFLILDSLSSPDQATRLSAEQRLPTAIPATQPAHTDLIEFLLSSNEPRRILSLSTFLRSSSAPACSDFSPAQALALLPIYTAAVGRATTRPGVEATLVEVAVNLCEVSGVAAPARAAVAREIATWVAGEAALPQLSAAARLLRALARKLATRFFVGETREFLEEVILPAVEGFVVHCGVELERLRASRDPSAPLEDSPLPPVATSALRDFTKAISVLTSKLGFASLNRHERLTSLFERLSSLAFSPSGRAAFGSAWSRLLDALAEIPDSGPRETALVLGGLSAALTLLRGPSPQVGEASSALRLLRRVAADGRFPDFLFERRDAAFEAACGALVLDEEAAALVAEDDTEALEFFGAEDEDTPQGLAASLLKELADLLPGFRQQAADFALKALEKGEWPLNASLKGNAGLHVAFEVLHALSGRGLAGFVDGLASAIAKKLPEAQTNPLLSTHLSILLQKNPELLSSSPSSSPASQLTLALLNHSSTSLCSPSRLSRLAASKAIETILRSDHPPALNNSSLPSWITQLLQGAHLFPSEHLPLLEALFSAFASPPPDSLIDSIFTTLSATALSHDSHLFITTTSTLARILQRGLSTANTPSILAPLFAAVFNPSTPLPHADFSEAVAEVFEELFLCQKAVPPYIPQALPEFLQLLNRTKSFKRHFRFLNLMLVFAKNTLSPEHLLTLFSALQTQPTSIESLYLFTSMLENKGESFSSEVVESVVVRANSAIFGPIFELKNAAVITLFALMASVPAAAISAPTEKALLGIIRKFALEAPCFFTKIERTIGLIGVLRFWGRGLEALRGRGVEAFQTVKFDIVQTLIFAYEQLKFIGEKADAERTIANIGYEENSLEDREKRNKISYFPPVISQNPIETFNCFVKKLAEDKPVFEDLLGALPIIVREFVRENSKATMVLVDKDKGIVEARKILKLKKKD